MKTKKITKRLELNKKTLVNLDAHIMKDVKGGLADDPPVETQSCKSICSGCLSLKRNNLV